MRFLRAGNRVTYEARLRRLGRAGARPAGSWSGSGGPREATPLDDFLTARWGAHVGDLGRTTYVPNRHEPWPLRTPRCWSSTTSWSRRSGFPGVTDRPPDHVAFSDGVHAEFGPPLDARQPR